jgi:hypothetical protein
LGFRVKAASLEKASFFVVWFLGAGVRVGWLAGREGDIGDMETSLWELAADASRVYSCGCF